MKKKKKIATVEMKFSEFVLYVILPERRRLLKIREGVTFSFANTTTGVEVYARGLVYGCDLKH